VAIINPGHHIEQPSGYTVLGYHCAIAVIGIVVRDYSYTGKNPLNVALNAASDDQKIGSSPMLFDC